jgi:hypothetical protein
MLLLLTKQMPDNRIYTDSKKFHSFVAIFLLQFMGVVRCKDEVC